MRGTDVHQESMFSYVSPKSRVPKNHPLRPIRKMVDAALGELNGLFERIYAPCGHPSIVPERLLQALLLQIFYSIRSERLLVSEAAVAFFMRFWSRHGVPGWFRTSTSVWMVS